MNDAAESPLGGGGGFGATTGTPTGEDAGIDANLGDADPDASPPDYSELCGTGCVPGSDEDPCAMAGSGEGGGGGTAPGSALVCQLAFDEESASLEGVCGPAGSFALSEPCFTNADCGGGLACVGELGACRRYCCGALEDCPEDTFCRPVPWAETTRGDAESLLIPVCWPASNCALLDETACPDDETCAIVRVDGTTSCVVPGTAGLGEACAKIGDCAAGFVCSIPRAECMKLCRISRAEDCDDGYTCQGGSTTYPDGFGVCVGGR